MSSNMPLPLNVSDLLHGRAVEWERLEFKAGWNPLDTLHTLCAFANDFHNLGGGYLVVGIAEKDGLPVLPPIGLEPGVIDAMQKEILNLGNSAIQPPYHPIVVPYEIEGRLILILWAPGGQTRPYKARLSMNKDGREYGYFIRKGSSTVRARGSDEIELLSLAATVPFDDRVNQRARLDDLSPELMRGFLEDVGSDLAPRAAAMSEVQLGRQMNVIGGSAEAAFPLNVGLLFFNLEPHRFFPATQIDVVWFPDGPGGDTFTEKVFRGPLPRMLREALDYIRRNYISETVIKHPDRAEATRVENFPFGAIEEAVVNAVYHRSYEVREPVEVRITVEDLVVLSYPGPDRSVRLDQLRAGRAVPRRYRNRRIGEFLKELKFTEGRATGIPKILRVMRQNGSPPPEFEFDEDHSYFQVRLPVHPQVSQPAGAHETQDGAHEPTTESQPQFSTSSVPVQYQSQYQSLEIRALALLESGELSISVISQQLGQRRVSGQLKVVMKHLLDQGMVEHTIPEKPNSKLQRYRLTARGRAWLAAQRNQGAAS